MHHTHDILDNTSTAILAMGADLDVVALNSSGQDLLETSEGRALGQSIAQLVAQPDPLVTILREVLRERSPTSRRGMPLTLLSGKEIHVDLMLTPIADPDAGYALLMELQPVDRLLKISREESLVAAQETTRAMIRGLAHEIKNPLGGVRGAAQLLARELPDENLAEYTNCLLYTSDAADDLYTV